MLKNRFFSAFAFVGLLSLAACGGGEEEAPVIEEPVVEQPAPTMEPAPMTTDTAAMPMGTDTGATMDTAAQH